MKPGDCVRIDHVVGTLFGKVRESKDGKNCTEVAVDLKNHVTISSVIVPEGDITYLGSGWCSECSWHTGPMGCENTHSPKWGQFLGSKGSCDQFEAKT